MQLIDHLDHLVLTCVDLAATKHFYTEVMQMQVQTFGEGRLAFRFGNQKINVHIKEALSSNPKPIFRFQGLLTSVS